MHVIEAVTALIRPW